MNTQITTSARSHMVTLGVQGAPDVDNRYGPGVMKPTQVQITYWYDAETTAPDVTVRLFGTWTREGGEETGHVMDQSYTRPQRNWPDWLVEIARTNQPKR
jgi:hypothetical protein